MPDHFFAIIIPIEIFVIGVSIMESDDDILLDIMTPHRLAKHLKKMEESNLPKELVDFVKKVAEQTRLAKEKGLITDEDLDKFNNRKKT